MKKQINEVRQLQKIAGILNEGWQGTPSYQPGSSDADDWDSGVDILIKSELDDKLKDKIIKELQKMGIEARFTIYKKTGETILSLPFAGDDANADSVLNKFGVKYQ